MLTTEESSGKNRLHSARLLAFFAVLILAALPLYSGVFIFLFGEWLSNEWARYGVFVPFMAAFIAYTRREKLKLDKEADAVQKFFGLFVVGVAVFASYFFEYNISILILTFPVFIAGVFLIFYGKENLKALLPALFFLCFLFPPEAPAANELGYSLVGKEARLAAAMIKGFIPAVLEENEGYLTAKILGGKGGEFMLTPACSSGYILIPFIVFSFFVALTMPGNLSRKLGVALVSLPLMFFINSLRLGLIMGSSYYFGTELALFIFHVLGGLTMFLIFIVLYLSIVMRYAK